MTMNYCGRCGSSNGSAARFCRHCGVELGNQIPLSTPSSPLNVEFAGKSAKPAPSKIPPPPPPAPPLPGQRLKSSSEEKAASLNPPASVPDPVSISASLRRIRQSGPLIIEAVKEKYDRLNERQQRINEIITQATETVTKEEVPAAQPNANRRDTGKFSQPTTPIIAGSGASAKMPAPHFSSGHQDAAAKPAKALAATSEAAINSSAQPLERKATGSSPAGLMQRGTITALASGGALPSGGPSSVLAQASGLTKQTGWESKFRMGVIALAMLLAAGGYFLVRDRLLSPGLARNGERNLLRAEEQSEQLARLGERERDQGNNDAALDQFRRALDLTPNNPDVKFLLAQTYASAGQFDEALKTFQSLLRGTPDHLEARLQLAEIHRKRGNWNAAYQEYQRIIGLSQNSGQATAALDAIEKHQAAQPDAPAPLVTVSARPKRLVPSAAPILPLGAIAKTQIPLLPQRAVPVPAIKPPTMLNVPPAEEKPDPRAIAEGHKKLGVRYLNVREYRAAIQEFLSAVRLAPEDKDLYYFIGSSYHGLNQPAIAYDYYRRVDGGPYLGPAQSGAKQTEKAAHQEQKLRGALQNEARALGDANDLKKTVTNE